MNKEIRGSTGNTLLAKYFDKIWPCSQKFKGSFSSILENTPIQFISSADSMIAIALRFLIQWWEQATVSKIGNKEHIFKISISFRSTKVPNVRQ